MINKNLDLNFNTHYGITWRWPSVFTAILEIRYALVQAYFAILTPFIICVRIGCTYPRMLTYLIILWTVACFPWSVACCAGSYVNKYCKTFAHSSDFYLDICGKFFIFKSFYYACYTAHIYSSICIFVYSMKHL